MTNLEERKILSNSSITLLEMLVSRRFFVLRAEAGDMNSSRLDPWLSANQT